MIVANGAYAVLDPLTWLIRPSVKNATLYITLSELTYIANLLGLLALTHTFCLIADIQIRFEAEHPGEGEGSDLGSEGDEASSALVEVYN